MLPALSRKLNDYYDLVENSFKKRGERNTARPRFGRAT